MERITTLANRLAEAILFDWDKEEVIKLAKEVAVACHENIEFVSLVKRMREAQRNYYKDKKQVGYKVAYYNMINKEILVDEYLKKKGV
jgi:hypothetical protein